MPLHHLLLLTFGGRVGGGPTGGWAWERHADLVQNLPLKVKRAYARTLHIKIPWTRLTSVPVEVRSQLTVP